jgi:hypothetical protein
MPYQPLTKEQYQKARQSGYTNEQIVANEKKRKASSTIAEPVEETPGVVQGIAQSIVKPFARFGASGLNVLSGVGAIARGDTKTLQNLPKKEYDLGYFGKVKGIGGTGSLGGDIKDAAGTALETAANIIPVGKIAPFAKATIGGKVLKGIGIGASTGLKAGTLQGAGNELQNPDATFGSVALKSLTGGAVGLVGGGVTGGVLPLPVSTVQATKNAVDPVNIMNRVARVNPTQAQKFNALAGEDIGTYLTTRGIYGTDEEIVKKLATRFNTSRSTADKELAKLGGEWKSEPVTVALNQLAEREARVSVPGALSKDFARVAQLVQKNKTTGLSMSEINEVKRLFERNVKTGYLKENNSDKIALATNVDTRLREWQLAQAKKLGLDNLDEINKETQLSKQLGDALYKKSLGQAGNNALGLTDAILLAGGDPNAIAMFTTKKVFGNKGIQSSIAKALAGKPTVGLPSAKTRQPVSNIGRLLEAGNPNTTNAIPVPSKSIKPLTPAEIEANNVLQNSRIQNTAKPLAPALQLPAGNPTTSYILNGKILPLMSKSTVEAPAKAIRSYSGLNQANSPTINTSITNTNIKPTLPPIPKKSTGLPVNK